MCVAEVATHIWAALDPGHWGQDDLQVLQWAAQLHEIGISIAYERFHHHGAYILRHGDCPGFLPSERERLARLIVGHRGKLKKVAEDISGQPVFTRQLLCLRLAALLCHARQRPHLDTLQWTLRKNGALRLSLPQAWAQQHPRSFYLLQEEAAAWDKFGLHIAIEAQ